MIILNNLSKSYKNKAGAEVRALKEVTLSFPDKGLVFILGKSGCGKSTLLNVIGGLDKPDSGDISVMGRSSKDFLSTDFDSYRNTFVGFVFQEYNILNEFTVEDNIAVAMELQGKKRDRAEIAEILRKFELEGLERRKPNTLSGGQKQRVAIARALIKNPRIILADEPTGSLDSDTGKEVLGILKKLSEEKLVIVVSHDREFAETYADRIVEMKDGKVVEDYSLVSGERVPSEAFSERAYTDEEKKLIRSRLPFRHALRMGAGGMKAKPVRLVFTVLLTAMAFIFFGVFSTLAMYDKVAVTEQAIKDEDSDYLKYEKGYSVTECTIHVSANKGIAPLKSDTYIDATAMTKNEYNEMAKENPSAIAVYERDIPVANLELQTYFYMDEYNGIAFSGNNGADLEILAGRRPENAGEAMIPSFMFRALQIGTLRHEDLTPITLNGYEDYVKLPSQSVFYGIDVEIVGVYASVAIDERFDPLRVSAENGTLGYHDTDWYNELDSGFYNYLFVHEDFYDTYIASSPEEPYVDIHQLNEGNYFIDTDTTGVVSYGESKGMSFEISKINFYPNRYSGKTLPVYDRAGEELIGSLEGYEIAIASSDYARVLYNYLNDIYSDIYLNRENSVYFPNFEKAVEEQGYAAVYDEYKAVSGELDKMYRNKNKAVSTDEARVILRSADNYISKYSLPLLKYVTASIETGEAYEITVKGIYFADSGRNAAYVSEAVFYDYMGDSYSVRSYETKYNEDPSAHISAVFIPKAEYSGSLRSLVSAAYTIKEDDSTFVLGSAVMKEVGNLNDRVDSLFGLLSGVWISFTVFAVILQFSLIYSTIVAKKKDIGILRALGARASDIFRIFFTEALIIALFCFVFASVASALICPFLNDAVVSARFTSVAVMIFGIKNAALICVVAVVTAVIATVVPIKFYASKTPAYDINSN